MKAEALLQHAAALVTRRRATYGDTANLFERVAIRWSQVLGVKVTPAQVANLLVDLKVARLAGDPRHLDSVIDAAGYAACLAEVLGDG